MKISHIIGVIIGIMLVSWAAGMVRAPGGFIDGFLAGTVGICLVVMCMHRDITIFRAKQVLGGFVGLDPLKIYERLFIREETDVRDTYLVVFRILNEKKLYTMFTAHAPPRYFKVTDDGDVLPYLRQIWGGKKTFPTPAKVYPFQRNHP